MEDRITALEDALSAQVEINFELLNRIGRLDNLVALVCTNLGDVMIITSDIMGDVQDITADLDNLVVGRAEREDETTS